MAKRFELDQRYVLARRVLLDALTALAPHGNAVIVVGAQAIYLRSGLDDLAIAPFTTDGDVMLAPALLHDDPQVDASMLEAGFQRPASAGTPAQPGTWIAVARVDGREMIVPIDLIVPDAVAGGGRRAARLGVHGDRTARRSVGLEAALVDHDAMTIAAHDPESPRQIVAEVAGVAALLVAKMHKIHDRTDSRSRASDKDAADVYRIMQTARAAQVADTFTRLRSDDIAGPVTERALGYLRDLFGRRGGEGVVMAQNALRLAVPAEQVATLCVSFTERVLASE